MKINENTSISMPMKNMLAIIAGVAPVKLDNRPADGKLVNFKMNYLRMIYLKNLSKYLLTKSNIFYGR